jgi:long-subunit acyl-CoA synthetase (AMP-forming)
MIDVADGRWATLEARTLSEAFARTSAERGSALALQTYGADGALSWSEYADHVRRLAAGLDSLGLRRGGTIAFLLTNRHEFNLLDTAAMHLGATCFSIYNTSAPEQIAHQLGDADPAVVVTETVLLDRLLASKALSHRRVIVVDGDESAMTFDDLLEQGDPGFDLERSSAAVAPDDVATLIYTSGTTGPPKGVQLTHANLLAEWRGLATALPEIAAGERTISYLPAAHLADRLFSHYAGHLFGVSLICCPEPTALLGASIETRPTVFGGVPRVFEKLKQGIEAMLLAGDDAARDDVRAALDLALRKIRLEQAGEVPSAEISAAYDRHDAELFAPARRTLGLDHVKWSLVGAAPARPDVLAFLAAVGLPVMEMWGLSETGGPITVNPSARIKFGTVGRPLHNVELRTAPDGELLAKGPTVMAGYRNLPHETAAAFVENGWLATGDIGTIDRDGYVTIVDRKKDLITSSGGKTMAPTAIEQRVMAETSLLAHAVAIGDRRPYVTALLVVDPSQLDPAAGSVDGEWALSREVASELEGAVQRANAGLARPEQIKRYAVLADTWEPGSSELTTTMKLRRAAIAGRYARVIEAMYDA